MKTILIGLIFVALGALATVSHAESSDEASTHFAAHFGMSFAISAFSYGIAKNAFHCSPTEAFVFSAVTTLMIGAVYKFTEIAPNDPHWPSSFGRAMGENALGIGAFGFSAFAFKF